MLIVDIAVISVFLFAGFFSSLVYFSEQLILLCKYIPHEQLEGILSRFLSFHDFPFAGTQKTKPTFSRP